MVDVHEFLTAGYVKVEGVVPCAVADLARAMLWERLGLAPDAPDEWTSPVMWVADHTGEGPFGELVRSPRVSSALDAICGAGGWKPRGALGNIPVRFPVSPPADDRGWHIDANTPLADGTWAVTGRPHTVLLLTLMSDVGADDAPTRVRVGSHRDVARALPGEAPLDLAEMGKAVDLASARRSVAHATGGPGDVYILHPFTVHAADRHRGGTPRFMAQSPVMLTSPVTPATPSSLACAFTG
jgi:hypothetical protein